MHGLSGASTKGFPTSRSPLPPRRTRPRGQLRPSVDVPDYIHASRRLLDELNFDVESVSEDLAFPYSADARAYDALLEVAPDVAGAVDRAAMGARTAFWSRDAVRNSLSWLLVGLIVTMFVGGTFIPSWGSLLVNALSGGFAALEVRRRTRPDSDD